jgi:creatinine amidohydrolase/Fe(II)-dependent formamide hydrolase-like protein
MEETLYRVARGLVADGWKVLVGVTGHDVAAQRDAIHSGIQRACQGSEAKGFGVMEGQNWHGGASMKYSMDHAGAWETSVMLYTYEDRVSLDELWEQMHASGREDVERMQMKELEGIGGWNPLKYASAELGQQIVEFCAERIGQKAIEVLEGRVEPTEQADVAFLDNPGPTD